MMSDSNKRPVKLFANGEFLAVVGSDKEYWLCKCRQHVYKDKTKTFWVQWLEKESSWNQDWNQDHVTKQCLKSPNNKNNEVCIVSYVYVMPTSKILNLK